MATFNIRPLDDKVVVKPLEKEEGNSTTAGGIVIPDTAKDKPVVAEVVAVGTGKVLDDGTVRAVGVKVGEKVLYSKYSGTEFKRQSEKYLVLNGSDLLAVVED